MISKSINCFHTKDRRLPVGTDVVEGLVEQNPELLSDYLDEVLLVVIVDESIIEHAEALVDPESGHGVAGVVEVFVCTKKSLKYLQDAMAY
ncbi:hypothetical protein DPMN_184976 [Dreissena polymorpha]|uniref:Uncharacterized protein n=1 Tax=Dreissena polymorpha TaxID=45954 RepID=A0A9D4DK83_DREPO|nr:hypothetical protein DPMN_184976 [Dreissena polymorpha]